MDEHFSRHFNGLAVITFALYVFFSIICSQTQFQVVYPGILSGYRVLQWVIFIVLVLIYIDTRPRVTDFLVYITVAAFGLYSVYLLHDYRMGMLLMFVMSIRKVNYMQLLIAGFVSTVAAAVLCLVAFGLGWIPDKILYRVNTGELRYSLGFAHPNYFGIVVLVIIAYWCILRGRRLNLLDVLISVSIGLFVLKIADARSESILIIVTPIACFVTNLFSQERILRWLESRIFRNSIRAIPLLLASCSVFVTVWLSPGSVFYNSVNHMLSSRLAIFQYYYGIAGVHLLPKVINTYFMNSTFVGMDNSYVYLFVSFGIVMFILYLVLTIKILNDVLNSKQVSLLIVTVMMLILGLVESTVIYPFVGFVYVIAKSASERIVDNMEDQH